jgi:hypothetical protein
MDSSFQLNLVLIPEAPSQGYFRGPKLNIDDYGKQGDKKGIQLPRGESGTFNIITI